MPRSALLHDWVGRIFAAEFPGESLAIVPASADASFRRYFRVTLPDRTTRIVMDAPPDKEDCRPFLQVAELFAAAGINVPRVMVQDLSQGFLLLSDLGGTTYLSALADRRQASALYRDA
ncbi:MAG: phosphotransferase, partial [Candidatus Accumulibacter sp.]|nr:phosphotransferase [Accumulibacter sp.]